MYQLYILNNQKVMKYLYVINMYMVKKLIVIKKCQYKENFRGKN